LCEAIESTIFRALDNFRDESELKYKKVKDKQLSIEQERKLEEEIARRLSSVDQILNKAKAKMSTFQIDTGVEEEEKKLKSRVKSVEPEESQKIDLYRVFVDDQTLKTKNASINKLRDIKKEGRDQIKELDAQ
jgi:hypothetical protein